MSFIETIFGKVNFACIISVPLFTYFHEKNEVSIKFLKITSFRDWYFSKKTMQLNCNSLYICDETKFKYILDTDGKCNKDRFKLLQQ